VQYAALSLYWLSLHCSHRTSSILVEPLKRVTEERNARHLGQSMSAVRMYRGRCERVYAAGAGMPLLVMRRSPRYSPALWMRRWAIMEPKPSKEPVMRMRAMMESVESDAFAGQLVKCLRVQIE
jgi:hypothetical protein